MRKPKTVSVDLSTVEVDCSPNRVYFKIPGYGTVVEETGSLDENGLVESWYNPLFDKTHSGEHIKGVAAFRCKHFETEFNIVSQWLLNN